jgi:hypothetical protein
MHKPSESATTDPHTPRASALAGWTPEQVALGKRWVHAWKDAGEAIERLRRDELRSTNTVQAMLRLSGAFESARWRGLVERSSGLIELQRILAKWRRRSHG